MPLYGFKCPDTDCNKHFDRLLGRDEVDTVEVNCPECKKVAERILSTFGNYTINGNNSASQRPKRVVR